MERMTGLDASFLYMETPAVPMNTINILLLDAASMRGGYSYERLRSLLERGVHLVPLLRRRVVEVPLGLHHPVWIEDPEFDLGHHLRRVTLAPPGDQQALEELVGAALAEPLSRARPLWHVTVVEGLEGGLVALVCKVHHAMIDGVAMAAVWERVLSVDPELRGVSPPAGRWVSEPNPGARRLVIDALRDRVRAFARLPTLVGHTALAGLRLLRRAYVQGLELSLPFVGPRASFNARLTRRRCFAAVDLPLADLQTVKSALGCTLNDVVLAVAAGGLRRYRDRRREADRRPLLAGVPVAMGDVGDGRLGGNRVSSLLVSLRTDIADPRRRLRAIRRRTIAAKQAHDVEIGRLLEKWAEYARPWLVRLSFCRVLPALPRPPINLVISNIRGAAETHYLAGAALARVYLAGPLLEQIGLNITVWSYRDTVHLGAVACPEVLPDLPALLEDCVFALAELVAAVDGAVAGPEPRTDSRGESSSPRRRSMCRTSVLHRPP